MATGVRGAHPTRQARQRAATYDTIVSTARSLLADGQPLTLRGVAGAMGASPAGLYRYVAHLDELQDLVAASIDESLAADVCAAIAQLDPDDSSARWIVAWTRVRRWALAHPAESRLVLTRPRSGGAPIRELSDGHLGELLRRLTSQHDVLLPPVPPDAETALVDLAPRTEGDHWPTALTWLHARVLTSLHGVIALETTGYLDPALVDGAAVYRTTMVEWLARFGQADDLGRLLDLLDAELAA